MSRTNVQVELAKARAEVARLEALDKAHPRHALARAAEAFCSSNSFHAREEAAWRGDPDVDPIGALESAALAYAAAVGHR